MANHRPIKQFHLPPAPVTITYTTEFEEETARLFFGLSKKEYDDLPGSPVWAVSSLSKCYVLQYYRDSKLMQSVSEFASYGAKK